MELISTEDLKNLEKIFHSIDALDKAKLEMLRKNIKAELARINHEYQMEEIKASAQVV